MKVARILALAAVATLAVTSASFAGGAVWFEASPTTSNASATPSGPGAGSDLGCDISLGLRCEWLVTVMYQSDGGASGWSLDIGTDSGDGKFTIKTQPNIPANGLTGVPFPPSINNPGGLLIDDMGGTNLDRKSVV